MELAAEQIGDFLPSLRAAILSEAGILSASFTEISCVERQESHRRLILKHFLLGPEAQGHQVLAKWGFCFICFSFLTASDRKAYIGNTDQQELGFVTALWRG